MSGENISGFRHPGDVDVRSFKLITAVGQIIDIQPITTEFNIYQSITEHYLQCDLVINDSLGLLNTINIDKNSDVQGGFSGGDVLAVSYKTNDGSLKYNSHFFSLYELSDRTRVEDKSEAYILSGISLEAYPAALNKISRAYGGESGSEVSGMVSSVLGEFMDSRNIKDTHETLRTLSGVRVVKENDIEDTVGKQKFILPNLSVDDSIDFFTKEAVSVDNTPYFFFYENSNGFNFKSIGSLTSQEVKQKYQFEVSNATGAYKNDGKQPEDNEAFNIVSFDVVKQGNFLDNLESGMFRTKTIHLDVLKKNKREAIYSYEKQFPRFKGLQKFRIPGGDVQESSVVRMSLSRKGHDSDALFTDESPAPKKYTETLSQGEGFMNHIFNSQIDVAIPGDSELNVGDIVYLKIPPATNLKEQDGNEDKYLSGKYLVINLRHTLLDGTDQMSTFLECVKDTGVKQ